MNERYKNIFKTDDKIFGIIEAGRSGYGIYDENGNMVSKKYMEFYVLKDNPEYIIAKHANNAYIVLRYDGKNNKFQKISHVIPINNIDEIITGKTNVIRSSTISSTKLFVLNKDNINPITIDIDGETIDTYNNPSKYGSRIINSNMILVGQSPELAHLIKFDEKGKAKIIMKNIKTSNSNEQPFWYNVGITDMEHDGSMLFLKDDGKIAVYDNGKVNTINFNTKNIKAIGTNFIITEDGGKYQLYMYNKRQRKMIKHDTASKLLNKDNIVAVVSDSIRNRETPIIKNITEKPDYITDVELYAINNKKDAVHKIFSGSWESRSYKFVNYSLRYSNKNVFVFGPEENKVKVITLNDNDIEKSKIHEFDFDYPNFNSNDITDITIQKVDDNTFILTSKGTQSDQALVYTTNNKVFVNKIPKKDKKIDVIYNDDSITITNKGMFFKDRDTLENMKKAILNGENTGRSEEIKKEILEDKKQYDMLDFSVANYQQLENGKIILLLQHDQLSKIGESMFVTYDTKTGKTEVLNIEASSFLDSSFISSPNGDMIYYSGGIYRLNNKTNKYELWKKKDINQILNNEAIINGYTDDTIIYGFGDVVTDIEYKGKKINMKKLKVNPIFSNTFMKIGTDIIPLYSKNENVINKLIRTVSTNMLKTICNVWQMILTK